MAEFAPSVWRTANSERHLFFLPDGTFSATTSASDGYRGLAIGTYSLKGSVLSIRTTSRIYKSGKSKGIEILKSPESANFAFKGESISAGSVVHKRVVTSDAMPSGYAGYQDPLTKDIVTLHGKSLLFDVSMTVDRTFKTFMGHHKTNKAFVEFVPAMGGDPTVFDNPYANNSTETEFAAEVQKKGLQLKMFGYVEDERFILVPGPFVSVAPPTIKYRRGQ